MPRTDGSNRRSPNEHVSGSVTSERQSADLATLLRVTSRTFALSIEILPRGFREQVRVAYLVLRVSDYLEDNRVMDPPTKAEALDAWVRILTGEAEVSELEAIVAESGDDDIADLHALKEAGPIVRELRRVPEVARRTIVHHTAATTRGMSRWIERGPVFNDEDDLDDYMHEVAGRVGWLVTSLAALRWRAVNRDLEERMHDAREFGLGLQTVNVLRGMKSDRGRGWVFVPRSLLHEGMTPDALFDERWRRDAVAAVASLADKAERHLDGAVEWLARLPRSATRLRVAFTLPLLLGVRTLALCRSRPGDVLTSSVKVDRPEVRSLVRQSLVLGRSGTWVRWKARTLLGSAG